MARQPTVPKRQQAVNRQDVTTSPGASDALSELVVHVFRLDGLLRSAGDRLAAPAGQTTARWRVLAAVDAGPLTVADIARAWWLSRQSVQRARVSVKMWERRTRSCSDSASFTPDS